MERVVWIAACWTLSARSCLSGCQLRAYPIKIRPSTWGRSSSRPCRRMTVKLKDISLNSVVTLTQPHTSHREPIKLTAPTSKSQRSTRKSKLRWNIFLASLLTKEWPRSMLAPRSKSAIIIRLSLKAVWWVLIISWTVVNLLSRASWSSTSTLWVAPTSLSCTRTSWPRVRATVFRLNQRWNVSFSLAAYSKCQSKSSKRPRWLIVSLLTAMKIIYSAKRRVMLMTFKMVWISKELRSKVSRLQMLSSPFTLMSSVFPSSSRTTLTLRSSMPMRSWARSLTPKTSNSKIREKPRQTLSSHTEALSRKKQTTITSCCVNQVTTNRPRTNLARLSSRESPARARLETEKVIRSRKDQLLRLKSRHIQSSTTSSCF